jgi:hypothetical protein
MKEKLLVIVYNDDLPQFEVMCHCLNLNWKGNRHLTVVCSKPSANNTTDCLSVSTSIVKQAFDPNWVVEIITGFPTKMSGYAEQQAYKIFYSLDDRFDNVIVVDCKDFLLKPSDSTDFVNDDVYNIAYASTGSSFQDNYPELTKVMNVDNVKLPMIVNLTPWIWRCEQLQKYWDHLIDKFGPCEQWTQFPLWSEIIGYFVFTHQDTEPLVKFQKPVGDWVVSSGVWNNQTFAGALEQRSNFDQFNEIKIWKHTRNVKDYELAEITASVLANYQVPADVINHWLESKK